MREVVRKINKAVVCKMGRRGKTEIGQLSRNHCVGGDVGLFRDEVESQKCWGLILNEIRA